eukprot:3343282-Ditylum_brightwellii.AAC.1
MNETLIPGEEQEKWEEKVAVVSKKYFPYLDMNTYWDNNNLHFAQLKKKIQTQGYLISNFNEDVESLDFMDQPCNCSRPCK